MPSVRPAGHDCVLWIEGRLSSTAATAVRHGLPLDADMDSLFFLSYAYDDIPLGTLFDVFLPSNDLQAALRVNIRVMGVTQQFATQWPVVPKGWKTICWLSFDRDSWPLALGISRTDHWDLQAKVGICTNDAYLSISKRVWDRRMAPPVTRSCAAADRAALMQAFCAAVLAQAGGGIPRVCSRNGAGMVPLDPEVLHHLCVSNWVESAFHVEVEDGEGDYSMHVMVTIHASNQGTIRMHSP